MVPLLEVNNLNKQFKGIHAVNDLSFSVHAGDVYGFLGQNGAGKSTTLRMLLKLIRPNGGEIIFKGKNIKHDHNDMLKHTGAVIERPDLYKYLSAYDNLAVFTKMSGVKVSRKLIMKELERVGLSERAQSKVKTFSQGMKQRLGIAIALIHSPDLVILDEPVNGLDPQGIADMRELILFLSREKGKTVIVSSHLLSEIELIANRMIIIHKGKKIVEGHVAELLDPTNTVVVLNTEDDKAAFQKLKQSNWSHALEGTQENIRLRMDKAALPELVASLIAMDIRLTAMQPRHSLEDYFLSLTNTDEQ